MRTSSLVALLAGFGSVCAEAFKPVRRNYETHDYYALHIDPSISPETLGELLGLEHDGPLGVIQDHHIFKAAKHGGDIVENARQELKRRRQLKRDLGPHILDSVLLSQKQVLRKRLVKRSIIPAPPPQDPRQEDPYLTYRAKFTKQLGIEDPIFNEQWHLFNPDQVGHDLNVTGVWLDGNTGKGAIVSIVDDGLDMDSLDLKPNYFAKGSYDFNEGVDEPKPRLSDDQHGTRCAGEVAAAKNDVCGVGVAYDSKVSGIRILSKQISDIDEAQSVVYGFQDNDIYSCSWGPPDDGRTMDAPGILIRRAMVKAVQEGRGGKGTIYVFAAGNGAANGDNCNFDGYTNSIYSITVGAIDKTERHPYYSEQCSAQLVVTYSSGAGDAIHTTDVGLNKCSRTHGGTSAAGPLAAGVYALVLSARPDLTWRDMQWLTVLTAIPIDSEPNDWQNTTIGKPFSHQFGYGKLDAWRIVEAAKTWKNVKPQAWFNSPWMHVKHEIPQGGEGLASSFTVTKEDMEKANVARLEHVTVTMNVKHTRRGDLSVELQSPSGMISHLSVSRRSDEHPTGYLDWTFMSVAHWGESGVGTWVILVKDTVENEHVGEFTDWKLKLFGEAIDGSKQELLPLPDAHDDDNHDATTTIGATKTSITISSTQEPTSLSHQPTRPAISKTTDPASPSVPPSVIIPSGSMPPGPDVTGKPEEDKENKPLPLASSTTSSNTSPDVTSTATSSPDHSAFLPSPFPTFGLSKKTQIWVYGALVLIILFCTGMAAYLFLQRRKRLRNDPRLDYEFEMLDDVDDDDDDDNEGGVGAGGRKRGAMSSLNGNANGRAIGGGGVGKKGKGGGRPKKRAGELYDAFAGESDEELFSESEDGGEGRYKDLDRGFNEKHGVGGDSDEDEVVSGGSGSGDASGGRRLR